MRKVSLLALIFSLTAGLQAETPKIEPAGGSFEGPVMVSVSQRAGAEVRVTVDGRDPGPVDYPVMTEPQSYRMPCPFRLAYSATVKARYFDRKSGQPIGEIAQVNFVIQPKLAGGVPFYPVNWSLDVADWWAGNPLNPKSAGYKKLEVTSPKTRIDVAEIRAKNPNTTTAGIEEALAQLPKEGGVLWFAKSGSPYIVTKPSSSEKLSSGYQHGGAIKIIERNNIHFLSDGATIQCGHTAFGFRGGEFDKYRHIEHPATNLYFRNLIFDGIGAGGDNFPQAGGHFHFINVADVMFDNCRFTNFRNPGSGHGGCMSLAFKSDNVWCRDCTFESGLWGVYWDGVHGGGFINCKFGNELAAGGVLLFTNDDLSPFDFRLRAGEYVVIAGCTFGGPDLPRKTSARCTNQASSNCLFIDNDVYQAYATCMGNDGKLCPDYREYRYQYFGNRILNNRFHGVDTILSINNKDQEKTHHYEIGHVRIEGNTAEDLQSFLNVGHRGKDVPPVTDILVNGNTFAGKEWPQFRAPNGGFQNVTITGNTLRGAERPIYAGPDPNSLPLQALVIKENILE